MPKIPIDFKLGYFDSSELDSNSDGTVTRLTKNCRLHTAPGAYQKTIIRGLEREGTGGAVLDGAYCHHVIVDEIIYIVTVQASSNIRFYSFDESSSTLTFIGNLGAVSITRAQYKLATNGTNIVLVSPYQANAKTTDYYYDIATNTLATINSLDPNYSSFEKALDVVYKDGYYVFITQNTIFHGDNVSIGTGLAFNVLSFGLLPSEGGSGAAIVDYNGRILAITNNKTYFYSNTGGTPFAFSLNVQIDLNIGVDFCHVVKVVDDIVYIVGTSFNSSRNVFILSGNQFKRISNATIDNRLLAINTFTLVNLGSYTIEGHDILTINYLDASAVNYTDTLCYDFTESALNGVPVWHLRDSDEFLAKDYLNLANQQRFPFIIKSEVVGSAYETVVRSLVFGSDETTTMEINIPKISNDSEPFFIKSIGFKFSSAINTAELQQRIVSESSAYVSLGSYNLSAFDNKRCLWRKINRLSTDCEFRLVMTNESGRFEVSEGFIET